MYKQQASYGSAGQVYSISLNSHTDFVKSIGLIDGKHVNISLSDTEFVSINKRNKPSPLNPAQALVRYQFVEILAKLAWKRFENRKNNRMIKLI